jgi:hypothetical protein
MKQTKCFSLLCLFICIICAGMGAQETRQVFFPDSLWHWAYKDRNGYHAVSYDARNDIKKEFNFHLDDSCINEDGYYRITFAGTSDEFIVLRGGNHMYFFPKNGWQEDGLFCDIRCVGGKIWLLTFQEALNYQPDSVDDLDGFIKWGIKNITATSVLVETLPSGREITYAPDNIHLRVFANDIYGSVEWASTVDNPPWVEGRPDEGIGEGLTVTFNAPVDSMLVLNGFVDPLPQRRNLFRENNRIKVAQIISDRFSFEYSFRDLAELAEIRFPVAVNEVQLIIKEVYYGTKYNDTVVTAIMGNARNYEMSHDF